MTKDQLTAIIKEIISEEILDEINSVGGPAGAASGDIKTPNAFKKAKGTNPDEKESDTMHAIARRSFSDNGNIVDENDPARVNEARSRYKNFKTSDAYKNSRSKLSYAVLEMKKMMKEVNFLVDVAGKLRLEDDIPTERYWKRTAQDLFEIEQYAKAISKKTKFLK